MYLNFNKRFYKFVRIFLKLASHFYNFSLNSLSVILGQLMQYIYKNKIAMHDLLCTTNKKVVVASNFLPFSSHVRGFRASVLKSKTKQTNIVAISFVTPKRFSLSVTKF